MRGISIEERAIQVAQYIIETEDTVRGAAKKFGISKSSIHKDVSQRLLKINYNLAMEVRKVLDKNKAERHIRGGMATKLKYIHEKDHGQPQYINASTQTQLFQQFKGLIQKILVAFIITFNFIKFTIERFNHTNTRNTFCQLIRQNTF